MLVGSKNKNDLANRFKARRKELMSKGGFDNLSTRGKILLLSCILCAMTMVVGIVSIIITNSVINTYNGVLNGLKARQNISLQMKSDQNCILTKSYAMAATAMIYDSPEHLDQVHEELIDEIQGTLEDIDAYNENLDNDRTVGDADRKILESAIDSYMAVIESFEAYREEMYDHCRKGDKEDILEVLSSCDELDAQGDELINQLIENADKRNKEKTEAIAALEISSTISIVICIIVSILLGFFLAAFIASGISRLIQKVSDASHKIAEGDFNVDVRSNLTNELGQLLHNFDKMLTSFTGISEDLTKSIEEMNNGDIDTRIDETQYKGLYRDLATQVNSLLENTGNEYSLIMESISAYSSGDFAYPVPSFPGKKAVIGESLDSMKTNLNHVSTTVEDIINTVTEGDFNHRVNLEGFEGEWLILMRHLSSLVNAISQPIEQTKLALQNLASANFSVHVDESAYKGEFASMIRAVNTTASSISGYVHEISNILTNMSNQNLDISIERDYIGDFEKVKTSLELIIDTFNKLVDEIIRSSEQIMIGSNSIADSSNSLAQGASQQAAAVEELNVTIGSVATNANHNTELVTESNRLAEEAKESADAVGKEMQEMYEAMQQINESSSNISAVLQAIDDIAFQTNILALNAAVEAARAGEHGKGFAIVADEVRNLASRSQTAVKDTATMIETAIAKAEQGSAIVDRTANTINKVISQIEHLSTISDEVAASSKQQNKSISEINIGIQQISEVVSANTATSEESAAASQELASQADVFTKMVSRFKLKRKKLR